MPWDKILSILLSLLGVIIAKRTKTIEAKKAYIAFIDTMEHLGLATVGLNGDDRKQRDELRARRNKLSGD